jgi:hypothetical protein
MKFNNTEVTKIIRNQLEWEYSTNRCINAFQVIMKPETLKIAYESIKSNPGNCVRGTDKETLDGITEE